MSNIINKVKDALHSDKTHEAPEGTHGPHSSRTANAADPRVDSDRDHRANPATGHNTTTGAGYGNEGSFGRTHEPGTGAGYNTAEGAHGPHSSRTANALDPRVDSDRDHRGAPGTSTFGSSGTHGTSGNTYGTGAPEGTHGPHSSRTANALDPRVDSDRDHRGTTDSSTFGSTGTHGTSGNTYGTGAPEGTHGPHSSRTANAADPRVDSDRDHRAAPGSTFGGAGQHTGTGSHFGSGPGPAANTAGPHKSDVLNKVDPRVDSDLDGSKTVGGNKTYGA